MEDEGGLNLLLPKWVAIVACTALAIFYVAILYVPSLILRLPPPTSIKSFLIRRFICAAVYSVISLCICSLILPIRRWDLSYLSSVYGIRLDHIWQAVVFPLSLTSLMYAGSLFLKSLLLLDSWKEQWYNGDLHLSFGSVKGILEISVSRSFSIASNISAWRNYLVAPLTEELVFRACMIPLLLCGGLKTYSAIFLCPIFFSLAHLNHLLEFYTQQNLRLVKALMVVGFQLLYTVVFGFYASFLFVRTGHLTAPLIAHMFCNFMGMPVFYSRRTGMISLAFIFGLVSFIWLLFPLTSPYLYNGRMDNCQCWHRYCSWS